MSTGAGYIHQDATWRALLCVMAQGAATVATGERSGTRGAARGDGVGAALARWRAERNKSRLSTGAPANHGGVPRACGTALTADLLTGVIFAAEGPAAHCFARVRGDFRVGGVAWHLAGAPAAATRLCYNLCTGLAHSRVTNCSARMPSTRQWPSTNTATACAILRSTAPDHLPLLSTVLQFGKGKRQKRKVRHGGRSKPWQASQHSMQGLGLAPRLCASNLRMIARPAQGILGRAQDGMA